MKNKEVFAEGLSWKKVFWIFIFGCVFGCVMETIIHFITYGDIVSRKGLIYGPLNPVYGLGAAGFTIFLCKRKNIIAIFIIAALLGGFFEFMCSYVQEYLFGTISWDYSNQPFNIQGRTSLKYMCYWGLLGILFVKIVYPFLSKEIEKIDIKLGNFITVIMLLFVIIDCAISIAAGIRQEERKEGIAPSNKIDIFIDKNYPDEKLNEIYENKKNV